VLASAGAYAVAIALMLWGLRMLEPSAAWARPPSRAWSAILRPAFLGTLAMLPLAMVTGALAMLLVRLGTGREPGTVAHDTLRQLVEHRDDPWTWASVALAVLAAPIAEELLFRVLIQSALVRALRSRWGAIVLTAALFAAIHLRAGVRPEEAYALAPILVVGIACGIAYERAGRAGVPILMHIAYNAANVALALVLA